MYVKIGVDIAIRRDYTDASGYFLLDDWSKKWPIHTCNNLWENKIWIDRNFAYFGTLLFWNNNELVTSKPKYRIWTNTVFMWIKSAIYCYSSLSLCLTSPAQCITHKQTNNTGLLLKIASWRIYCKTYYGVVCLSTYHTAYQDV